MEPNLTKEVYSNIQYKQVLKVRTMISEFYNCNLYQSVKEHNTFLVTCYFAIIELNRDNCLRLI